MNRFHVTDEGGGIVRVDLDARLVTRRFAESLCAEIERTAASATKERPRLLMNLAALAKATPGAGFYALRRLKDLDPAAIALFKGNRFMRGFARVVLGLARFRTYALFDDEGAARAWLQAAPAPDPRAR